MGVAMRDGRDDILQGVKISSHHHDLRPQGRKNPRRAQALLIRSVKSAFALLLTKVTKPRLRRIGMDRIGKGNDI
jgi:hypothetical protein